jgi:ATP-dependent helicase HrpB
VAYRLWSEAEHAARRAWPDPEITAVDLAALALELSVWGAPVGALRWLTPPPPAALAIAGQLLEALGAVDGGRPTELGRRLVELPVHPRLARMLLAASGSGLRTAAILAALLSERDVLRRGRHDPPTTADVATRLALVHGDGHAYELAVDRAAVALVRRRADELVRRVERAVPAGPTRTASSQGAPPDIDRDPGPLLVEAYPDRIAQARGGGRYRLRHGGGAVLPDHDPLAAAPWLVAPRWKQRRVAPAAPTGGSDWRRRLTAPT